jgi:hypothetical protein
VRTLLVTLVVLLLAAVGADRVAEKIATDRAETRLAAEGLRDPQVEAGGFPFLTQLLDRRFDDVHVTAAALEGRSGRARDLDVTATSVALPGDDQHGTATVGSVRATGLVTYDEVLRRAGAEGVRLDPAADGRVRLRGDAEVLGQTVPVAAVGKVVANGRSVRVEPTGFEVDGSPVDSASLLDALGARFTLTYRLRDLPAGVRVTDVTAGPDGFRVAVAGHDVALPTGS